MTIERMTELLLTIHFVSTSYYKGKKIDQKKLYKRYLELAEEFLKPYVIDNTSKEG